MKSELQYEACFQGNDWHCCLIHKCVMYRLKVLTNAFRNVVVVHSENAGTVSLSQIQDARIVVGTSCCGTGLDLRLVEHVIVCGMPYSTEQLLQWAGRCRSCGYVTVIVPNSHMHLEAELSSESYVGCGWRRCLWSSETC